jgi:hypothetical protein
MAVQIALEREGLPAKERARLKRREAKLLQDQDRWLGADLVETIRENRPEHKDAVELTFRRGWLQGLSLDLFDHYTNHAPQNQLLEAIVAAPETRWVLSLTIKPPDQSDFRVLGSAPFLPVLRRLHVGGDEDNSYSDRAYGAEQIIRNAPRLESVALCMKEPWDKDLFQANLPHLREIIVGCAWSFATEPLAANPSFRNVRVLRLVPGSVFEGEDEPRLGLLDLERIAHSPHLVSLAELRFSLSDAGDEGIEVLEHSGLLHRLEVLDLSFGTVTDAGANALVTGLADRPHRLRVLNLWGNQLTEAGIAALQTIPGLDLIVEQQYEPGSIDYLFNGNME